MTLHPIRSSYHVTSCSMRSLSLSLIARPHPSPLWTLRFWIALTKCRPHWTDTTLSACRSSHRCIGSRPLLDKHSSLGAPRCTSLSQLLTEHSLLDTPVPLDNTEACAVVSPSSSLTLPPTAPCAAHPSMSPNVEPRVASAALSPRASIVQEVSLLSLAPGPAGVLAHVIRNVCTRHGPHVPPGFAPLPNTLGIGPLVKSGTPAT